MKVPLFLLKNACGPSYKPFYIFFVVPLRGHFSIGILTKNKKRKVKCLYSCELQQELHVHNTFSIFQPTLPHRHITILAIHSKCSLIWDQGDFYLQDIFIASPCIISNIT